MHVWSKQICGSIGYNLVVCYDSFALLIEESKLSIHPTWYRVMFQLTAFCFQYSVLFSIQCMEENVM